MQTVRMMAGTNEEQKVRTVAGSEDGGSKNEEQELGTVAGRN